MCGSQCVSTSCNLIANKLAMAAVRKFTKMMLAARKKHHLASILRIK